MTRHLSSLLLGLLLVVAVACDKKKDPEPDKPAADPVEGWWKVESSYTRNYAPNGSLVSEGLVTSYNAYFYQLITPTTFQTYENRTTTSGPLHQYTRQGNVLTVVNGQTVKATIVRVTATELELEFDAITPQFLPRIARLVANETYTRVP